MDINTINSFWSTKVKSFNSSSEFGNAYPKAYDQGNEDRNWNEDHKFGFGLPPEGGVIFGFDGYGDPKVLPRPKRPVPLAWSEEYGTLSLYWRGQWCVWGANDRSLVSGCSVEFSTNAE